MAIRKDVVTGVCAVAVAGAWLFPNPTDSLESCEWMPEEGEHFELQLESIVVDGVSVPLCPISDAGFGLENSAYGSSKVSAVLCDPRESRSRRITFSASSR